MPENITQEDLENMSPEEIIELQKKNCIFCKIIKNEIPSKKVYEDDYVSVILDINPASEGHLLILPKEHFMIMPNMPEELIGHMFIVARELSQAVLKTLDAEGTTIFAANGQIAGQKAPHFMIHVIPRKENDELFEFKEIKIPGEKLDKLQKMMKQIMPRLVTGRDIMAEEKPENEIPEYEAKEEPEQPKTEPKQEQPKEKSEQKPKEKIKHTPKETPDLDKISRLFLNK
ncbi:HIT domain-containing protein [Candidatus Woesearchaeota archaeon]|nr:HIT domain-containing protein [Candidatus Woesearchaeota archaeon]